MARKLVWSIFPIVLGALVVFLVFEEGVLGEIWFKQRQLPEGIA